MREESEDRTGMAELLAWVSTFFLLVGVAALAYLILLALSGLAAPHQMTIFAMSVVGVVVGLSYHAHRRVE